MRPLFYIFCACLTFPLSVLVAADAVSVPIPGKTLAPFFAKYCVDCHGPDEQEAQVRLDTVSWQITNNDTAQRWQDLLDVLNSGDMPPEGEDRPNQKELIAVLRQLTATLQTARERLSDQGGEITMRRLNSREYVATIRELFGFDVSVNRLPPDAETESFDTVGVDQYFTSSDFDQLFNLAKDIVKEGIAWSGTPRAEVKRRRFEPENKITPAQRKAHEAHQKKLNLVKQSKSWKEAGFKDEGAMKLFINRSKKTQNSERYLELPRADEGQYISPDNSTKRVNFGIRPDPRGKYRFRIHGGVRSGQVPLRHYINVRADGTQKAMKLLGTESDPQTIELISQKQLNSSGILTLQLTALHNQNKAIDPDGDWAPLWIDYMESEGPLYPKDRSFFEQLIYSIAPEGRRNPFPLKDEDLERVFRRFALRAFRGVAPADEYIEQLVKLYLANRKEGQKIQNAMVEPLAVILTSPQFLFLQEATETDGGRHFLTDRELAIRLSYFLWSCPPDEELYRLAAERKLSDEWELRGQVDRMLEDPKSETFFEGFMGQWAELQRFDAITVDRKQFPRFSEGLRQSARREVVEFFKVLVREDLPVENLIDSDFVVADPLLREHYGLDVGYLAADNEFDKIDLPSDSQRGGLLGQMAFLTLGSNGERSSPVIRGAWVMEKLLHNPPPPPPPNVPELGSALKKPATNREMVIMHQKQTVCSSCHQRMDVIGFGLENFDTIGGWRATESVGRKQIAIEAGGTLPSGAEFKTPRELKSLLMTQKHHLALELCESLAAYGIGRTMEFGDTNALYAILRKNHPQDFRVRSMIAEIVTSPLFRKK